MIPDPFRGSYQPAFILRGHNQPLPEKNSFIIAVNANPAQHGMSRPASASHHVGSRKLVVPTLLESIESNPQDA